MNIDHPDAQQEAVFGKFMEWLGTPFWAQDGDKISITSFDNQEMARFSWENQWGGHLALWMTGNFGDDGEVPILMGMFVQETDVRDDGSTFQFWRLDALMEFYEPVWVCLWTDVDGHNRNRMHGASYDPSENGDIDKAMYEGQHDL